MKPKGQQQDEAQSADDRFAAIVAAAARGELISAADTDFWRRHEETHPDAGADADLFGALGSLGDPPPSSGLSDAALAARVMERARGATSAPASARLAAAAVSRRSGAGSPGRRRGVAAVFAAVALAATLVVAFAAELRARLFSPVPAPITDTQPRLAPSPEPMEAERPLEDAPLAPGEASRPQAAQREAPSPPPTSRLSTAPTATERASADELLRRAQAHLAAGRAAEAVDAYRELCARYPASAEGRAALVSLGRLALDQGRADEALGHLDRYLAASGPLDEEARYWRIEALSRLGRASEEAAAIGEFLHRHPDSVHAQRLHARAATLGGD